MEGRWKEREKERESSILYKLYNNRKVKECAHMYFKIEFNMYEKLGFLHRRKRFRIRLSQRKTAKSIGILLGRTVLCNFIFVNKLNSYNLYKNINTSTLLRKSFFSFWNEKQNQNFWRVGWLTLKESYNLIMWTVVWRWKQENLEKFN